MRRGWKIAIAIGVVLAALIAVNTVIVNQETKGPRSRSTGAAS